MTIQLEKKQKILIAIISLLCLIFSSCSKKLDKNSYLALVDNKPIYKDNFEKELSFYQKFYIKKQGELYLNSKDKNGNSNNKKLETELIDSMIKDQVFLNDLNSKNIEISKNDSQDLFANLSNIIGNDTSLLANIEAFGSDQNEFNEILFRDSIRKKHWDYFVNNNKIDDKEIRAFYNKNPNLTHMYKYDLLIFDDKLEAEKIRGKIKNSTDFRKFLESDIRNYDISRSDFVYSNDRILKLSKVSKKDQISDVFKDKGLNYILMINSLNTNENDLLVRAKQIYLQNEYDKYVKNLIKNSNIKLFVS